MDSAILWKDAGDSVFLLDIPRSIEAAQGTAKYPNVKRIVSSPPQAEPFVTNEPKSKAAKLRVKQNLDVGGLEQVHLPALEHALRLVRDNHNGPWNLPRIHAAEEPNPGHKRRQTDGGPSDTAELDSILKRLAYQAYGSLQLSRPCPSSENDIHERAAVELAAGVEPDTMIRNESDSATVLVVKQTGRSSIQRSFLLPSNSAFYCGDCSRSSDFRATLRADSNENNTSRKFDLILLDPPWPNRSVKRTQQTPNSTYSTQPSVKDIKKLLLGMDLDTLLGNDGLLGIWITNRPAIRQLLLDDGGIFSTFGLTLEEEWLWLKVTTSGQPIFPLESVWRKPYEVCLIARKADWRKGPQHPVPDPEVRRRVIVAVPDLHSRKPCLKDIFEPLLSSSYRALEVFGRHLVSGWHSWGDQCIKFNEQGYWQDAD